MSIATRSIALFLFLVSFTGVAQGQTFEHIGRLPGPAPGSFSIVGTNLPDGRFILWNGDTVFIQSEAGGGIFGSAATGYAGDPGFIAMAPDGRTALLGAGFSTRLYLLDTHDPQDYTVASEIAGPTHFSGVFLAQDLVLLDRATDTFDTSELVILDLSSSKSAPQVQTLMTKPPLPEGEKVIVTKPSFAFSSSVRIDPTGTLLYVMDGNTRELRTFLVADVLNAHNTMSTLDWVGDGTAVGAPATYFGGGVAGFTLADELVIGGSEGFGLPGGIQIVDPMTGTILTVLDPAGNQAFYNVIFNQTTGSMITRTGTGAYFVTLGAIAPVPVSTPWLLALITLSIISITLIRYRRFVTRS